MKVTFLGHAGMYLETTGGSILCDPWFNPAYFASWFPFPSNEDFPVDTISAPDYLFVSHLHQDHFDPEFLAARISRAATVLLPDYPLDELRRQLQDLGFSRFETLPNGVIVDLDGLRVMAATAIGPSDGPFGDCALAVDDGTARLLNQNDARPRDLDAIRRFGPYDAHFLQFSGAIWYPVVYDMDADAKAEAGRLKRVRGMDRALLFADDVSAASLFPCAGPPCFLDDGLFGHNDLDGDDANPFPDQTAFLDYVKQKGRHQRPPGRAGHRRDPGRRGVPTSPSPPPKRSCWPRSGTSGPTCRPTRPGSGPPSRRPGRRGPAPARSTSWPSCSAGGGRCWPQGDRLCANVGAPVLLEAGDVAVVIDFPARQVRAHGGEHCPYRFRVEPGVMEASIRDRSADWVNGLFLSLRFRRPGTAPTTSTSTPSSSASPRSGWRYAESWAGPTTEATSTVIRAHRRPAGEEWCQIDGWRVQGRCPHLQGDLSRFGSITDDVLTCKLHGWQFDLPSRRCLTTGEPDAIRAERL